ATAGDDWKPPPAAYSQVGLPVLMSRAYSRPRVVPKKAWSPTITAEPSTAAGVLNVQSGLPLAGSRPTTNLPRLPTTSTSFVTAADERYESFRSGCSYVHSTSAFRQLTAKNLSPSVPT